MHLHPSQTPCSRFAAACIDAGRRWARVAGVMSLCHIVWSQNDTADLRISTIMPLTHLSICWSPETVSTGVAAGPSLVTSSWQIAWEAKSGGAKWEMNIHDATGEGPLERGGDGLLSCFYTAVWTSWIMFALQRGLKIHGPRFIIKEQPLRLTIPTH